MAQKMIVTPNQIARRAGYNRATEVVVGRQNRVIRVQPFGYRKFSDGSYVSNAYRNKFGWKNTYYQNAEVVVEVNAEDCY